MVAGPCPPLSSLGSPFLVVEIDREPEIFAEHLGIHPPDGKLASSCNSSFAWNCSGLPTKCQLSLWVTSYAGYAQRNPLPRTYEEE